jgi:hypothetical protein
MARGLAIVWHTENEKSKIYIVMKTLSLTIASQKNICAMIAILLAALVLMSAKANASDTLKAKPTVKEQNWLDLRLEAELLEISQQIEKAVSPTLQLEKTFRIVDQNNELVYEGTVKNMLFISDKKLNSLLRKSLLLIDFQGVAHYMIER